MSAVSPIAADGAAVKEASPFRPPRVLLRSVAPPRRQHNAHGNGFNRGQQHHAAGGAPPAAPVPFGVAPAGIDSAPTSPATGPRAPAPLVGATPPLGAIPTSHAALVPHAPLPPSEGFPMPADALSNSSSPSVAATAAVPPATAGLPPSAACDSEPDSPELDPIVCPEGNVSSSSIEKKTYDFEEMKSLRQCNAHTPMQVVRWLIADLYKTHTSLSIPSHLGRLTDLPADLLDEDRTSFFGSRLKTTQRIRPVRELHHKVMSVLSRITHEKYKELSVELMELPLRQSDDQQLRAVVEVFFEKAVAEPTFSELYGRLVADICTMDVQRDAERGVPREQQIAYRMRRELLQRCQDEFQRPLQLSHEEQFCTETGAPLAREDVETKKDKLKRRLCGNIKFVGELYRFNLVTERVLESIFKVLVGSYDPSDYSSDGMAEATGVAAPIGMQNPNQKEDYVFEVFATLMKVAGKKCNHFRPELIAQNMQIARKIRDTHPTKRITFLMMDLDDLERRNWEQKASEKLMTTEERERAMLQEERRIADEVDRVLREQKRASKSSKEHHVDPRHPHGTPTHNKGPRFPAFGTAVQPTTPTGKAAAAKKPAATAEKSKKKETAKDVKKSTGAKTPSSPASTSEAISPSSSQAATPTNNSPARQMPRSLGSQSNMLSDSDFGGPSTPVSPAAPIPHAQAVDHFLSDEASATEIASYALQLSKTQRTNFLTLWLRKTTTTTKLSAEREALPEVLYLMLQRSMAAFTADGESRRPSVSADDSTAGDSTPEAPSTPPTAAADMTPAAPFTGADLSVVIRSWIAYDIDHGQYDNCPRMFANWGEVVTHAAAFGKKTLAAEESAEFAAPAVEALLAAVGPSSIGWMLRELHYINGTDSTYGYLKQTSPCVNESETGMASAIDAAMPVSETDNVAGCGEVAAQLLTRFRPAAHANAKEDLGTGYASTEDTVERCMATDATSGIGEIQLLNAYLNGGGELSKATTALISETKAASTGAVALAVARVVSVALEVAYRPTGGRAADPLTEEQLDDVVLKACRHAMLNTKALRATAEAAAVAECIAFFTQSAFRDSGLPTSRAPSRGMIKSHSDLASAGGSACTPTNDDAPPFPSPGAGGSPGGEDDEAATAAAQSIRAVLLERWVDGEGAVTRDTLKAVRAALEGRRAFVPLTSTEDDVSFEKVLDTVFEVASL